MNIQFNVIINNNAPYLNLISLPHIPSLILFYVDHPAWAIRTMNGRAVYLIKLASIHAYKYHIMHLNVSVEHINAYSDLWVLKLNP